MTRKNEFMFEIVIGAFFSVLALISLLIIAGQFFDSL